MPPAQRKRSTRNRRSGRSRRSGQAELSPENKSHFIIIPFFYRSKLSTTSWSGSFFPSYSGLTRISRLNNKLYFFLNPRVYSSASASGTRMTMLYYLSRSEKNCKTLFSLFLIIFNFSLSRRIQTQFQPHSLTDNTLGHNLRISINKSQPFPIRRRHAQAHLLKTGRQPLI